MSTNHIWRSFWKRPHFYVYCMQRTPFCSWPPRCVGERHPTTEVAKWLTREGGTYKISYSNLSRILRSHVCSYELNTVLVTSTDKGTCISIDKQNENENMHAIYKTYKLQRIYSIIINRDAINLCQEEDLNKILSVTTRETSEDIDGHWWSQECPCHGQVYLRRDNIVLCLSAWIQPDKRPSIAGERIPVEVPRLGLHLVRVELLHEIPIVYPSPLTWKFLSSVRLLPSDQSFSSFKCHLVLRGEPPRTQHPWNPCHHVIFTQGDMHRSVQLHNVP